MSARDIAAFPYKSASQDVLSFVSIVPIGTGGLPSVGTGGNAPSGAVGVPSGVFLPYRPANGFGITRLAAGKYQVTFAPAPNGTVRAWIDLQSQAAPTVLDISTIAKDIATGYVQLQCYNASGASVDPANGDSLAIEFVAFSTGNAAGP